MRNPKPLEKNNDNYSTDADDRNTITASKPGRNKNPNETMALPFASFLIFKKI